MNRLINILEKIQITVGVLCLSLFFAAILIQITTRHLGISVIWTEEVANYAFIWAVFMGASVMVNRRDHFSFDYFEKKLKPKPRAVLNIFNDCLLISFNIAILFLGIQLVQRFWDYNWVAIPELKMGYVWISIPVMAVTMVIYTLSHLIRHVKILRGREAQT